MSTLQRVLGPLVVLLLVAAAAVVFFADGDDQKTITAYFPRTVSIYEGSDVRILGVPVGTIDTVEPEGTRVKVTMSYDPEVRVPDDATALIVSPSVVGDRYVQLTPAFTDGDKVMADDTTLEEDRTAVPIELDQIYESLDELTVALGPDGANSRGALTDLLEQTAENFDGQGAQFNETIRNFSELSATLDDNKEELFGSAAQLQQFITTLAENDQTVRDFNTSLASVSDVLADERDELDGSLRNLATALTEVGRFVRDNREVLGRNIDGLNRVAKVLADQRGALDEILKAGPLALNNLALTYNPDTGTLDTNANIGNTIDEIISDPAEVLCALVAANDPDSTACDTIRDLLGGLGGLGRNSPFAKGLGSSSDAPFDPTLSGLVASDGATS